jgi:ATP-dependent exoDNAse (exonuclease V) beta subunit
VDPSEGREAEPDLVGAGAGRARRGRAATALGRAVHATLQTLDLATLDGLDELARAQAEAERIPDQAGEVARLVRTAAESEPVLEAVAGGRYWREVPVGAGADGAVLEGVIDLLYETAEGWAVADFKTDQIGAGAHTERYRAQTEAYARLVERATGRRVARTTLVFASSGETQTIRHGEVRADG